MIGDGNIVGSPYVHRNTVLSRSSIAAPAVVQAGTVLVDSHIAGAVTVAQATLIGVRVTGEGSIRGRLVLRPSDGVLGALDPTAQVGVMLGGRVTLEGVDVYGHGQIRGRLIIEPTEQAE